MPKFRSRTPSMERGDEPMRLSQTLFVTLISIVVTASGGTGTHQPGDAGAYANDTGSGGSTATAAFEKQNNLLLVGTGFAPGPGGPSGGPIYTVHADGTDKTLLMNDGGAASWTPDGKVIFSSLKGESFQIWIMDADGSNAKQVGNLPADMHPLQPQMGNNGLISFMGNDGSTANGNTGIWTMQKDGSGLTELVRGQAPFLALSGTWVAYTLQTSTPDGAGNSFNRQIWRINTDGTGNQQLTFLGDPDYPDANAPAISPDEKTVAFFSGKEDGDDPSFGHRNVAVVPATGGPRITLTPCTLFATQAERAKYTVASGHCFAADNPAWTPDGQWLIFDTGFSDGIQTWMVDRSGQGFQVFYPDLRGIGRVPLKQRVGDIRVFGQPTRRSLVCPPGGFAGGLTLPPGQNLVLTTACDVNGNLVIGAAGENASMLTVQGAVLTVHGDILLAGTGNLTIRGVGSSLRLDNQHDFQRHIETRGTSSLHLDGCSVVTNIAGASVGKLTSTYSAYDSSTFTATNVTLDNLTNWLLGDFRDSSTALFTNSIQVPTEVYAHDHSTITSTGPSDQHGLWMILASGTSGSLTLPNPTPPVTWSAGRNSGLNVGWQIDLVGSKTSLAIESHAGSSWDIHSSGSSQKETTIGVFVDPASTPAQPMTFANLPLNTVGTSSTPYSITPPGAPAQLSLYGVNLGPIAWQIYAGGGGAASVSVTITNSPINEVVAFAGGHVEFSNSVAQWSVVGAVGANASMHVTGSNLWDARTFASGGGTIRIDTSTLHGSILEADVGSVLEISDTLTQLYANGNSTSKCDIVASAKYMATHNGVPLCNPYSPAGQLPARLGAGGTIAISGGHPACFAAGGSYAPGFVFDPGVHTANPAGGSVQCSGGPQPLFAAFAAYPVNLQGASAGKAYTCVVTTSGGTDTYSVTTPTCQ